MWMMVYNLPWISKLWWTTLSSKNPRQAQVTFNPAFSRSLKKKYSEESNPSKARRAYPWRRTRISGSFLNLFMSLPFADPWSIRKHRIPFSFRATSTPHHLSKNTGSVHNPILPSTIPSNQQHRHQQQSQLDVEQN